MNAITRALPLAVSLLAAPAAWATGGFACKAETRSGKQISVDLCMAHGIASMCSDLKVSIDDKQIVIPRAQVPSFYIGKLKENGLVAIKAYDAEMSEEIVDLVFEYDPNGENYFADYTPALYGRLILKNGGTTYKFSDLRCFLE
jgi:hypothetical protein